MVQISDLLPAKSIRLGAPAQDWREAIQIAGDLLSASGAASVPYTEAMIRAVEEHGPYIAIAPGFALAHARPGSSVSAPGLSFVRLAHPVPFGHPTNDPIQIVMGLAATADSEHQSALMSLALALGEPNTFPALATAQSPEQVLNVFAVGPSA